MFSYFVFVIIITVILCLIYWLINKNNQYWAKKNVPYAKPLPLFGNYVNYILLKENIGEVLQKLCRQFYDKPYFGAFFGTEPVLVVQSPELLKHILTKDFYYFNGREVSEYATKETLTQILFFTGGDRWKIVRHFLTPFFSSSKMKNMFYLIEKCCHMFEDMLDRDVDKSNVIEAKQLSARYTMDSVCSCAFGVEANTMMNPDDNPFKFMGDEIFHPTNYRGFILAFRSIWPSIFYSLGLKCFPDTIAVFFSQMLKNVFKSRDYKPSPRNDFVDLVLHLKNEDIITGDSLRNVKTGLDEKVSVKVDDDLLVAQCTLFFAGGFETSASTISFTLYEFAKNPEVQKRAAEEVDEYLRRHGNKLNYECINELPYINACMLETIRMYPVFSVVTREVMEDCVLPDGLQLDKGVRIHIPVYSMHRDPDYFPDPEEYNPERFLPENSENIKQYTFFPYGEGPRICIGKRFAEMQVIAGLISFLKKWKVELADGMPKTVTLECRTFNTQPRDHGLMLKLEPREGWEQRIFVRS